MAYKYEPIAKEDTYELIEKAQNGDEEARELIVSQNTGLVKNLAMKYSSGYYETDDLMQVGFLGLVKAIDRFDTGFDVMFSTYAVPMILGEIKRYIRDDGKIKVSRQLKTDIRNLRKIQQEYYNRYGCSPKISYLAANLGVSKERVMEILEAEESLASVESLDNDLIPEGMHGGEYVDLKSAIGELEERERQIIVLRYFRDMTQQQIAGRLGISQVQVSRTEKRVLQRMREHLKDAE